MPETNLGARGSERSFRALWDENGSQHLGSHTVQESSCSTWRLQRSVCTVLGFDCWPAAFKLLLHITPDCSRLVIQLMNLDLRWLFELVKSVLALDNSGLSHEEFELGKRGVSLMSAPSRLNLYCCQDRTVGTFVLDSGIFNRILDLDLVCYAGHNINFRILLLIEISHLK